MKTLEDCLIQTRGKLTAMSVERERDQKAYYDAGRHDTYTLFRNQVAILEELKGKRRRWWQSRKKEAP